MRRSKLGDVYYFRVPNGYKIVQFAYRIPKRGNYLRVFPGLYESMPDDIPSIINGPHSYIIGFHISRAYRIGLAVFIDNMPVPEAYPFPMCRITLWPSKEHKVDQIWIHPEDTSVTGNLNIVSFSASRMGELPGKFRDATRLSSTVSPDWLLYLFDHDFNLEHPERFWPRFVLGDQWEEKMKIYQETVDEALEQDVRINVPGHSKGHGAVCVNPFEK